MSTRLDRAWAAISLRRWDVALEELTAALAEDPESATAHALRAEVLYRREQFVDAQLAAQDAIAAAPDYGWGYYWRSWSILSAGQVAESALNHARQTAEEALRCDPCEPAFWALLGQVALSAGEFDQAAEHAQVGLTHAPEHESCLQVLAAAQKAHGASEQQRLTLLKLLKVNPASQFAHRHLASNALAAGNSTEAFEFARAAVQLDPSDADARVVYHEAVRQQHPWIRTLLWTNGIWERCTYILPVIGALPLLALIFIRGNPKFADDDPWFWAGFCFFILVCCYGLISAALTEFIAAHSRRLSPLLPEAASIRRTFYLVGAVLVLFAASVAISFWWGGPLPLLALIHGGTIIVLLCGVLASTRRVERLGLAALSLVPLTVLSVSAICNCQPNPVVWFIATIVATCLVCASVLKITNTAQASSQE